MTCNNKKFTYWNGVGTRNECVNSGTARQEAPTATILIYDNIISYRQKFTGINHIQNK